MWKRMLICPLLLALIGVSVVGSAGAADAAGGEGKALSFSGLGEPQDLGAPIAVRQTFDAAFGVEDGANVMYTTVSGSPSAGESAIFNVVDIDNEKLLRSFPLAGVASSWTHVRVPNGEVFIGTTSKVFVYSPETKQVRDLGIPIPGTGSIYSLVHDEEGNVYGGIYSPTAGGRVFKIDGQTYEMTDLLGRPVDNGEAPGDDGKSEMYVRSLAYHNGYLYAGTGSANGRVWKIDLATKETASIGMPELPDAYKSKENSMQFVYGLTVVGDELYVFWNGTFTMHVYNMKNGEWRDKTIENVRGLLAVTPEHNGKVYTNKRDKYMWEIDVETLEERQVIYFDGSIRSSAWLHVANQPEFPGIAMVTVSYDGAAVLYDPPNGKMRQMNALVDSQAINIQALETGPDGKLYMSSYGDGGAQYDPAANRFVNFPLPQSEGIGSLGDTVYFGVYPKAQILAYDTTTPLSTTAAPAHLFDVGEAQDRPFVVTAGAGKLYIGTIPGYGELGGAITVYDPDASASEGRPVYEVFRNVVENQSISGLLYANGLIYGSTTVHGGLGSVPAADKAKLFVWDPAAKRKAAEWEPQLEGKSASNGMISGLTLGPDGLIWAAMDGVIFAFDPVTKEIVKSRNLYPSVTNYSSWRPIHQRWGADGLLYSDVAGRLVVLNPDTLEFRELSPQVVLFTLDEQDNVYAAKATRLYKYAAARPGTLTVAGPGHIAVGQSVPLTVAGELFGWDVDLASAATITVSDPQIAVVENGILTGLQEGTVTLTASFRGTVSQPVTVEIADVDLDIRNAGFEETGAHGAIPGWSLAGKAKPNDIAEISSDRFASGNRSLKLVNQDNGAGKRIAVQSDLIEVLPEMPYAASVKLYLDARDKGKPVADSAAEIRLAFYDAEGGELPQQTEAAARIDGPLGQWTEAAVSSTAPAAARYVRLFIINEAQRNVAVYADDASIVMKE
ncbi:quinonprotein alcohol dehydrogenase-like domain-containing protein [Paenibacillus sp. 32O-W]|uniref:hypothetical protein n=1 Tax=Paenibacillus sp. 32O-W TaxID=1695218 RepID=UPI000721FE85|nr:hypothetical protein [Paenibacillus sp. 32O-W]ALS29910.1 quinonprotein alcohol dehydrogenase-like domain-containing protein [Paenibacillus sp. 32O-W]